MGKFPSQTLRLSKTTWDIIRGSDLLAIIFVSIPVIIACSFAIHYLTRSEECIRTYFSEDEKDNNILPTTYVMTLVFISIIMAFTFVNIFISLNHLRLWYKAK